MTRFSEIAAGADIVDDDDDDNDEDKEEYDEEDGGAINSNVSVSPFVLLLLILALVIVEDAADEAEENIFNGGIEMDGIVVVCANTGSVKASNFKPDAKSAPTVVLHAVEDGIVDDEDEEALEVSSDNRWNLCRKDSASTALVVFVVVAAVTVVSGIGCGATVDADPARNAYMLFSPC